MMITVTMMMSTMFTRQLNSPLFYFFFTKLLYWSKSNWNLRIRLIAPSQEPGQSSPKPGIVPGAFAGHVMDILLNPERLKATLLSWKT
jgi:hypothetical protein